MNVECEWVRKYEYPYDSCTCESPDRRAVHCTDCCMECEGEFVIEHYMAYGRSRTFCPGACSYVINKYMEGLDD